LKKNEKQSSAVRFKELVFDFLYISLFESFNRTFYLPTHSNPGNTDADEYNQESKNSQVMPFGGPVFM